MGLDDLINLVADNLPTTILAAASVVFLTLLAMAVSGVRLSHLWRKHISPTELRFRNVFAMMGRKRQDELIETYARKYRCGRIEAMGHALDQRDRDVRSWR